MTKNTGSPALRFVPLYDLADRRRENGVMLDRDGNIIIRKRWKQGLYRFRFEVSRGSFDGRRMFFLMDGQSVGPSVQYWRIHDRKGRLRNNDDYRYGEHVQVIAPLLDVYLNDGFAGRALTDFPSHREFRDNFHFGEFALELGAGTSADEIKLVNGLGYRLRIERVGVRTDERKPVKHIELKNGLRGKHPRLFFDKEGIKGMRKRAEKGSRTRWADFQKLIQTAKNPGILPLITAYVVGGEKKYFMEARRLAYRELVLMGGPEYGANMWWSMGAVEVGERLEMLLYFYDFCHEDLTEEERLVFRSFLVRTVRWFFKYIKFQSMEWPGVPGSIGHNWYNLHGLGMAGLVFWGEEPEAAEWLDWAGRNFDLAKERTPADGSVGWAPEHCVNAHLHFAYALNHAAGINQLQDWDWYKKHPIFRFYGETPDYRRLVPGMDTVDYDPHFIAWEPLASLLKDPRAQWLAERYREKSLLKGRGASHGRHNPALSAARRFIFHNPAISVSTGVEKLPPDRVFETGHAFLQTGFLDNTGMKILFTCGTERGYKVIETESSRSYGGWADANSLVIFNRGEQLITCATESYRQYTANHSTLTFDGLGQIPEGTVFGCTRTLENVGRITDSFFADDFGYVKGQAGQCYEPEVGLQQFDRQIFFLKPDLIFVTDEVELKKACRVEINFVGCIAPGKVIQVPRPSGEVRIVDGKGLILAQTCGALIVPVHPQKMKATVENCRIIRHYCDYTSEYKRVTFSASKVRKAEFTTVIKIFNGRKMPRIDCKTMRCGSVKGFVLKNNREDIYFLPAGGRKISVGGEIEFQGKYLIGFRDERGSWRKLIGIGTSYLKSAGRIVYHGKGKHIFLAGK